MVLELLFMYNKIGPIELSPITNPEPTPYHVYSTIIHTFLIFALAVFFFCLPPTDYTVFIFAMKTATLPKWKT